MKLLLTICILAALPGSLLADPPAAPEESPSLRRFAQILASHPPEKPLEHLSFHPFSTDELIQRELMEAFRSSYPKLLEDALKSSGNMHNPKVLPLRAKFSECLLKTPTLVKLQALLLTHGHTLTGASLEKFEINKETTPPSFRAYVWLQLEPTK